MPSSPLFTDGAHGRVYASTAHGDVARLSVFDGESGDVVDRRTLEPAERLFHVDVDRRELFLYYEGKVRVLDADSLAVLRVLEIPYNPVPEDWVKGSSGLRDADIDLPAFDPKRRELVKVEGGRLQTFNVETGVLARSLSIRFPVGKNEIGTPIYSTIDQEGRYLYLATRSKLQTWIERSGTDLIAIDMQNASVVDWASLHVGMVGWLAWPKGMIASMTEHKWPCCRQRFWRDGHERRQISESIVEWTAYDSRRDQIVGIYSRDYRVDDPNRLVVASSDSLQPKSIGPVPPSFTPSAYDAPTDRFYGWRKDRDGLELADADGLYASVYAQVEALPHSTPMISKVLQPSGVTAGEPALVVGAMTVTLAPGSPRPKFELYSGVPVASRDGSAWFSVAFPRLDEGDCFAVSPAFERDETLFACLDGLGILRSEDAGRSWKPATAGIDGLELMNIALSPDFERDRSLLATARSGMEAEGWPVADAPSFSQPEAPDPGHIAWTAWRSRNAGEQWEAIGRYAALTFSPGYAKDREIFAFAYLNSRFLVSTDLGTTWEERGRLPELKKESFVGSRIWVIPASGDRKRVLLALGASDAAMGGGPQWPAAGSRLFRSTDDGHQWDLAWEANISGHPNTASGFVISPGNLRLVGPLASGTDVGSDTPATWIMTMGLDTISLSLLSGDGGVEWRTHHLPPRPHSEVVGAREDGSIVVRDLKSSELFEVSLEDFKSGWPPN